MKKVSSVALCVLLTSLIILAADWPTPAGGPQRNSWARAEGLIDKSNVSQLQLLYKFRAENTPHGLNSLTSPIINGNIITYVGFKEMLIFGASSGKVFSVDADVNKPIWVAGLTPQPSQQVPITEACPGGLSSPVLMAGSSSTSRRFFRPRTTPAAQGTPVNRSPFFPPLSQTLYPLLPTTLSQLGALYTVSSDGYLHILNSSTGQDLLPAIRFIPPNAKVTSLNLQENVVYATTGDNCDGYRNALFALDLLSADKKVTSFMPQEGNFAGTGGTTIGNDGTVYVQVLYAPGGSSEHPSEAIVSLTPKDLTVKDYFMLSTKAPDKSQLNEPGITPVIFAFGGRDLLAAGGRDGRLYLLDSKSLGGPDHHTPLFISEPMARADKKFAGYGFRGSFTSWLDFSSGTRWLYAPLFGPPNSKFKLPAGAEKPVNGAIVGLKLAEEAGRLILQTAWLSEDMQYPASPVSANGMVFVLATGESPRLAKQNGKPYSVSESQQVSAKARLIVLDGTNGKQLYSSENTVNATSHNGGLAVANGRVYFTAQDNAAYCFGLLKGQSQLSEQH